MICEDVWVKTSQQGKVFPGEYFWKSDARQVNLKFLEFWVLEVKKNLKAKDANKTTLEYLRQSVIFSM